MNKEIIIETSKNLKLNNVISRELPMQNDEEVQRVTHMFGAYIKTKGLTAYGPMIIFNTSVINDDVVVPQSKLMVQVREDPEALEQPYNHEGTIRISNCLLAKYHGDLFNLPLAYSKIQIYAFEHDLELKGDTYSIFVKQDPQEVIVDVFVETLV